MTNPRGHYRMTSTPLSFEGCNFFRQRLVLATLSGRAIKITKIRVDDDYPGLRGDCVCVCVGGWVGGGGWGGEGVPVYVMCMCAIISTLYTTGDHFS